MDQTSQGIVKTGRGEEQPADKDRAQLAHQTTSPNSPSREATGRPEEKDRKAPGSR
ncbi:hypothetical protein HL667_02685 [Bradyrhizobium sp. 83012]|uniref:Uncharacterized protein n=1 Tax=Bradyrhizobium aeschynomenes TaxID=2734909 RepID=A0ABX2C817_9BRAD|nr:hypothetical protein [Bradyrhizobium aeschynomenes]NPU12877.1 hypothetical protein [Bradyrhizobium aeschynomenes]NPU63898.1 hypothetical protein [Bradyrhizobium aeschynomenes]NPV23200.1 hypothetical protein [Bradyrhizobium aeschynomenes]